METASQRQQYAYLLESSMMRIWADQRLNYERRVRVQRELHERAALEQACAEEGKLVDGDGLEHLDQELAPPCFLRKAPLVPLHPIGEESISLITPSEPSPSFLLRRSQKRCTATASMPGRGALGRRWGTRAAAPPVCSRLSARKRRAGYSPAPCGTRH